MGFFGNLKDALRIDSEEDDDDLMYEREMDSIERKNRRKTVRKPVEPVEEEYYDDDQEEYTPNVGSFDSAGRFNPPRSPESYHNTAPNYGRRNVYTNEDGSETTIIKVKFLNDTRVVCDYLINGEPVVVSFDRTYGAESQRIMDFLSGCIYALDGNVTPISESMFMFSPRDVIFEDQHATLSQKNKFGVPTFNKMI